MADDEKNIFISYSRKDDEFARKLATSLSELGARIWIDIEDIPAGMNWSSAVQDGLDKCRLMIVIISPDSIASRNVETEWQYYYDEKKPVVPIRLKPAKIHFQLRRIQYVDFYEQDYDSALKKLSIELEKQGILGVGAERYFERGRVRVFGDLRGAIADLTGAIHLKADYYNAYIYRGVALHVKYKLDASASELDVPLFAELNNHNSQVLARLKNEHTQLLLNAIQDFTTAINLDPDLPIAYYCRGRVYETWRKRKEANLDYQAYWERGNREQREIPGLQEFIRRNSP